MKKIEKIIAVIVLIALVFTIGFILIYNPAKAQTKDSLKIELSKKRAEADAIRLLLDFEPIDKTKIIKKKAILSVIKMDSSKYLMIDTGKNNYLIKSFNCQIRLENDNTYQLIGKDGKVECFGDGIVEPIFVIN